MYLLCQLSLSRRNHIPFRQLRPRHIAQLPDLVHRQWTGWKTPRANSTKACSVDTGRGFPHLPGFPSKYFRFRPGSRAFHPARALSVDVTDANWRESAPCWVGQTEARDAEEQKTRNRSLAIGPLIVYPDGLG
jgi:hypothetical protein